MAYHEFRPDSGTIQTEWVPPNGIGYLYEHYDYNVSVDNHLSYKYKFLC